MTAVLEIVLPGQPSSLLAMSFPLRARLAFITLGSFVLFGGTACRELLAPHEVSGIYALVQYDGQPATAQDMSGSMTLGAGGAAERRLRHDGGAEQVAVGTFAVTADGLDLRLRENGGTSQYEWRPAATLVDGVLTLRHPHPADGPDIVEVYRRQ